MLIHAIYGLGFTTLFFRNYYEAFPTELVRAAQIDGASFFQIFRRILLPSSGPIIVVTVIWQFTNIWNDFLFGSVLFELRFHPDHGGAQQPRQLVDWREGIQCPFRRRDPRGPADAHRLRRFRTLLRARPDGRRSQGIKPCPSCRSNHLEKSFGATHILKDVSLEIEEGGFLVLVGPSGCGKSTLLNTIAGLEPISGGEIRIAGRDVAGLHPSKRDIAMVFQSYALYPNMTVAGNIAFGMEIRGVPKPEREAAIAKVADMLQIGHLLNRKPCAALRRPAPARRDGPGAGA